MAKGSKGRSRVASRRYRSTPYSLRTCNHSISEYPKKCPKTLDKKDWEDATCSVCMECPHNAVLLLCSSHDKGCRPYMCGTSFRYSNCLDQYKKAYTKVISPNDGQVLPESAENPIVAPDTGSLLGKCEAMELACPLCRGQVKGWTVVQPARDYLNSKQRSCMQEDCSFVGSFKELRKHMKADHPTARPREVDPSLEQKWRRLERERERDDVISTIRSTMPGAMVFGDYVIEGGNHPGLDTDGEDANTAGRDGGFEMGIDSNLVNMFLILHAFGASGNDLGRRPRHSERSFQHATNESDVSIHHPTPVNGLEYSDQDDDDEEEDGHGGMSLVSRGMSLVSRLRRQRRVLLNRSGRRRRRREINETRDR